MMQVNSIHHRRLANYGVHSAELFEPCKAVYVVAWLLRQEMDRYGNTWTAVGAHRSKTPKYRDAYVAKVRNQIYILARQYERSEQIQLKKRPRLTQKKKAAITSPPS